MISIVFSLGECRVLFLIDGECGTGFHPSEFGLEYVANLSEKEMGKGDRVLANDSNILFEYCSISSLMNC